MSPAHQPAAATAAAGDKNRVGSWLKSVVGGFGPSASTSASVPTSQPVQQQQQQQSAPAAARLVRKNSSSFFASFTRASSDRSRSPSRSGMLRANSPLPPTPTPDLRGRSIFPSKGSKLPSRPTSSSRDRETLDRAPTALSMRASPMPNSVASRAIRSSSPAPSASSTLAAERLVRLSDAQLAELASQVSAEAYRRRTPIGALLSTYERASQSHQIRTVAPTTSARIAIMTNEKFKVFAADLHSEAIRRDIPGIDIFGSRTASTTAPSTTANPVIFPSTSISRSNTLTLGTATLNPKRFDGGDNLGESGTPPGSPLLSPVAIPPQLDAGNSTIPTKLLPLIAAAAVAANSATTSPPAVNAAASPPQTPSTPATIQRSESKQNLRDSIGTADMTPEDRVVAVDRMTSLSDVEFSNLLRDVRNELNSRSTTSSDASDEVAKREVADVESAVRNSGGSGREDGRSSLTNGVSNQTQRRLIPSAVSSGITAVANTAPILSSASSVSVPPVPQVTPMQGERLSLLRRVTSVDLDAFWDDMQKEVARREALGVVLNTTDAVGTAVAATAAEPVSEVQEPPEVHTRRKLPLEDAAANVPDKAEAPNVVAWRNRIAKLTNEQLAEVTADVFDEITRRKEKKEPFLPPRDDLSLKRNEARKELSKLPSKELKTLWTIIHDNMTKRNML
ncbi:hypothetical protein HDU84_005822 [Entophlyctis sp. JEL0112]|nr:hypothetical protein HDU84_005822 [Entophlyctis sp. JEL0112]